MKHNVKMISIAITMAVLFLFPLVGPTSGHYYQSEDVYTWDDVNGTDNWIVEYFDDKVTGTTYAFEKGTILDYDSSQGSIDYGIVPGSTGTYGGDVLMEAFFDPNDPGIQFNNPSVLPFPTWSTYQPLWTPNNPGVNSPPYTPFPDILGMPPDVYVISRPTSQFSINDDGEHAHFIEWDALPLAISGGDPPAPCATLLPYSISEIEKPIATLSYNNPELVGTDSVKFWISIDPSYIDDAQDLYGVAVSGTDPFQETYSLTDPSLYLELGHVSLISSSSGIAPLNIGFVADPSVAGKFYITDSCIATNTLRNIAPYASGVQGLVPLRTMGPLPFVNPTLNVPSAPSTQVVPTITDIVLQPSEAEASMPLRSGEWFMIDISMKWDSVTDTEPSAFSVSAYDEDGFYISKIDLIIPTGAWDCSPDMFYSEFASPVHDPRSPYLDPIVGPTPRFKMEGIRALNEVDDSSMMSIASFIAGKVGTADWKAPGTPSGTGNGICSVSFFVDYPIDEDADFDPAISKYGIEMFEMADPTNIDNFIIVAFMPAWIMFLPKLTEIDTDYVPYFIAIYDGKEYSNGDLSPSMLYVVALDEDVTSNINVEWNKVGEYTLIFEGMIADALELDPTYSYTTLDYQGETSWSNVMENRFGKGMVTYYGDAGYDVTMNIVSVSAIVEDMPGIPVLDDPVVTSNNGYDEVALTWTDTSETGTYYVYYKSATQVNPTRAERTGKSTILNIYENGEYTFWVSGYNESGESAPSNMKIVTISITTLESPVLDPIVKNLATNHRSAELILSWSEETEVDEFEIYRSTGSDFTLLDTVANDVFEYTENITTNGTYSYYITAVIGDITENSNIRSSIVLLLYPGRPQMVLLATTNPRLDWNDTINTEYYLLYRSTESNVVMDAGHLYANITVSEYLLNVSVAGTWYYKVIACMHGGVVRGTPSNTVQVKVEGKTPTLFDTIWGWILSIIAFITSLLTCASISMSKKLNRKPSDKIKCPDGSDNCNLP